MALGSDTCRHILQTGLLNCGLEHTGTELRNVRTFIYLERSGGGGGGGGCGTEDKRSSTHLDLSQHCCVSDECSQSLGPDI